MEMHGFDLNPRLVDRVWEVLDDHLPDSKFTLYNENGVSMDPLKDEEESFDAIITDPPYLNCPDLYTDDPDDLSNMKQPQWEDMMRESFRQYHRLIKTSSVRDKVFYPLMLRMTSDPTKAWTEAMQEAMERSQDTPMDRGTFHPVIMKMNASRRAETGMVVWTLSSHESQRRRFTPGTAHSPSHRQCPRINSA